MVVALSSETAAALERIRDRRVIRERAERAQIREAADEGGTVDEIAVRVGRSPHAVARILARLPVDGS